MEPKIDQQPATTYNAFTHIIDKGILNFFIGLLVSGALAISELLVFLRHEAFGFCPLIMLLVIALGFVYAFGGIGITAGNTKEKSYKVTLLAAIFAAIAGSFAFMAPICFVQSILAFLRFLIPRYSIYISTYVPHVTNMKSFLESFCEPGQLCVFSSSFGNLLGSLLDTLILGIGLAIFFSIINSITAILKISSK